MEAETPTIRPVRIDGAKLKRLRKERFISRVELGHRSGLHPDHIGRLERGNWEGGSRIDNIRKLAEGLGVDPHEIIVPEED